MDFMSALRGDWVVQGFGILFGTFLLEDAATVLAAMDVQVGRVPLPVALGTLYIGIVLGDLGLYGLRAFGHRLPWARCLVGQDRVRTGQDWLEKRVFKVVFISRFLPGARLPTYAACGFLGADLRQFVMAAVVATLIWTSILFGVSLHVGRFLIDHFGAWRWAGMAGFALTILLAGRMAARLQEPSR